MDREELIEIIANYFGVSTDIDSYDWEAGCNINGGWLCLKQVLYLCEEIVEDIR